MKAPGWSTRIFGFSAMIAALLLAALLVSTAPSYAAGVADDVPGTPMGPGGASGVVDTTTRPRDVYAVYLFAGQQVTFDAAWASPGYWGNGLALYGPRIATIDDASWLVHAVSGYHGHVISYLPAVDGVYYLETYTDNHGQGYTVTVLGDETMPLATTTALSGASTVKVKRKLALSGTVSPAESPGSVIITRKRLVGSKWKNAGSATVAVVGGTFAYSFKPAYRGKWRLVAKYQTNTVGDTTYVTSHSRVKTVTVR